jgi:hypothetical protein
MESTHLLTFWQILQPFSQFFRADVVPTFFAISLAWIGTIRGKRTSNFARTLGPELPSHLATYYRFFASSKWCLDSMGVLLFCLTLPLMGLATTIRICIDDTLLKRRGASIFAASMFRDAVLSSRSHVVTRWGLNWVVLVLAMPHPLFPGQFISIPLMTRLFLTKEWCEKTGISYQTPSDLAVDMMRILVSSTPDSLHWRLCGDGSFANKTLLKMELPRVFFTGRMQYNASIQEPLECRPYRGGRRPIYGLNYPKPHQMVACDDYDELTHTVSFRSYQGKEQTREVIDLLGMWKDVSGAKPLRFVLVKAKGKNEAFYLVTTDLDGPLEEVLHDFISRWCIEVCFFEAKQWMGVENSQVWCQQSVSKMPAFGFWLMGLIKVWYLKNHASLDDVRIPTTWYNPQGCIPFSQMLATLRVSLFKTLLGPNQEQGALSSLFGLEQDPTKRQEWILRVFCGC